MIWNVQELGGTGQAWAPERPGTTPTSPASSLTGVDELEERALAYVRLIEDELMAYAESWWIDLQSGRCDVRDQSGLGSPCRAVPHGSSALASARQLLVDSTHEGIT
jgi:hypothetical protein